jgi:hypothetical protein
MINFLIFYLGGNFSALAGRLPLAFMREKTLFKLHKSSFCSSTFHLPPSTFHIPQATCTYIGSAPSWAPEDKANGIKINLFQVVRLVLSIKIGYTS